MNKYFFGIAMFLSIAVTGLYAQPVKSTLNLNQVWSGYSNQARLSNRWGIWTDLQLRTKENFTDNLSQTLVRLGLIHYLNENTRLAIGYAWVNNYPGDNHPFVSQPEHRIWQQVQWYTNHPRLRLMQWVRLEEKYKQKIAIDGKLADGYEFNWKLRYHFLMTVPLNKKAFAPGTFSLVTGDELHINFGQHIVYNYFDQNRFFIGFNYYIHTATYIQFGYMNQFQQLASGNQYKNADVARLFYFQYLDFRKKRDK